ncbi:hypothetical protein [Gemmatimonas sp.]|uniref:hypothetical protein n=1 Tax=Gemmatimonas sp. TaxID=1962908 RepID=UPI0039834B9E
MTRTNSTAGDVARRLWEQAARASTYANPYSNPHANDASGAAAMRLLSDLEVVLSRWIGSEGFRALLLNAARLTLPAHPVLSTVLTVDGVRGVPHDAPAANDAIASGVVALLEVLMQLLGRIVGDEMAVRLIDQAGAPSPRGTVSIDTHEERNDQAR